MHLLLVDTRQGVRRYYFWKCLLQWMCSQDWKFSELPEEMIRFTACGDHFNQGIKLYDQERQRSNHGANGLLATDGCRELIWYSKAATKVLKSISCASVPVDAVICDFTVSNAGEGSPNNSAIAILLTSDLLQLHLFNGETFDIHLPIPMVKIFSSSAGLLLQRKPSSVEFHSDQITVHSNRSSQLFAVGTDVGNFNAKLWLNESNNDTAPHSEAFSRGNESPFSNNRSNDRLMSPRFSDTQSPVHFHHRSVESPHFFSLAHPTAPVRPVSLHGSNGYGSQHGNHAEERRKCGFSRNPMDPKSFTIDHTVDHDNSGIMSSTAYDKKHNARRAFSEQSLLAVEGNLLCTLKRGTSCIVLWHISHSTHGSHDEGGLIHPCTVDDGEHIMNSSTISQATSTTIANTSVLEGRYLPQRDLGNSSPSFLSLSGNNTRSSVGSSHSRPDSMGSHTLSMNVSHSTGASAAGGMITSALMPYGALSGPSISLERERERERERGSKRAGAVNHTAPGVVMSTYPASSPAPLFVFSPLPLAAELLAPTRQSNRLANQRRAATLRDVSALSVGIPTRLRTPGTPSPSPQSTPFSPPSAFSSVGKESVSMADLTVDTSGLLHTSEYHTQGRMSPNRFTSHQSHSRSHKQVHDTDGEGEGEGHDDHHISTLPSDTHMITLCSLDLSALPGIWGSLLSTSTVDLDKDLKVTISGGEDSLGGLQIHFLLLSEGAYANFRIVSNPTPTHSSSSSGIERTVPHVTLHALPQSDAARDAGICSVSHIQIPLGLLHEATATRITAGDARQGLRLGRCRGSSNMLPVTLLMHSLKNSLSTPRNGLHHSTGSLDVTPGPTVTLLIGGYPVGGEGPLTWTDDLEGFGLLLNGSDDPRRSSCLSLHSLGVHDCHMLCVGQSTDKENEDSFVLTGPACLFGSGEADSINGVVAQAICTTLRKYHIVKETSQGSGEGSIVSAEVDCDFLVAEILAVMLLAQSEFGASRVLRVLLSAAFGMPLEDLTPLSKQRSSSMMLTKAASFHDLSSSFVCLRGGDAKQEDAGSSTGHPLRAVLFDIFHSTLQDTLLRGKGVDGDDGLRVRILCSALSHALSGGLCMVTSSVGPTSDPTTTISLSAMQYYKYYRAIINNSEGKGVVQEGEETIDLTGYQKCLATLTTFTCNPTPTCTSTSISTVPHVLDWVIECIRCVENTADCTSIPPFYTPEGSDGSLTTPMNNGCGDVIHPFPAITYARQFFQYLFISIHGIKPAVGNERDNQEPEAVANAFIKASKGNLTCLLLLPPPLRVFIELALRQCKEAPYYPVENDAPKKAVLQLQPWPTSVLKLIGRNDLSAHLVHLDTSHKECSDGKKRGTAGRDSSNSHSTIQRDKSASLDGLTEIEEEACRLRFSEDDRVHEVCRLLRSSAGVYLRLEKAPEVSDLDYRHKLQMRLLVLCRRSLACPVGRGALTLGSLTPLMAEALPCPPLSLSGRIPPNNTPLLLHTSTAPKDLSLWPQFHNGVAAGLRVSYLQDLGSRNPSLKLSQSEGARGQRAGSASTVTRNWIIYNRTATADDSSFHAGVLLALGLQGHLRVLSVTDICDYLTQGNQPTTIALLVGLPSSRLGTADPLLSKTLCLHVPSLLPPQHWDIEILPQVQTAALIGLGLLYCNSGHRLMTEFLLAELGRRPTADRDRGDCREAVSFAAAWALGVVLLGRGKAKRSGSTLSTDKSSIGGMGGLTDLCIEDRLYQHLEGGKRPPDSNLFPHAGAPQGDGHAAGGRSSRVMEGDKLNTGITGPGAAVALGLIYIRSGNEEICSRLALPHTAFALDSVRPDLLLYRAVSRCLILWDAVEPTSAWIDSQVPEAIIRSLFPSQIIPGDHIPGKRRDTRGKVDLDPRSALAVYLNIITGYCWGMGLVYAGTAHEGARDTLLEKLKILQGFRENKLPFPLPFAPNAKTLRPLIESCIGSVSLALSCVMAGTGDLMCLRIFRSLRWKVDDVTYGTHLSFAMAIGLLFLSGGSASLRRDPMSCACLLMATAPRFPVRTVDNQYHLQALRHLYVLAVEARALQIVDVDQGSAVSVDIEILLLSGEILLKKAPCLLPELITVQSVRLPSSSTLYYSASMVITTLEEGSLECVSRIPHPLYVKKRPSSSLFLHAPQRAISTVNREVQGLPLDSTKCFTDSLRGMLSGGKSLGSLRLYPEGGQVESQIGLEYFLQAATEHFGFKRESSVIGYQGENSNLINTTSSLPFKLEGNGVNLSTPYATLSDIVTTLSTVGPLTSKIFLQAMIESNSAKK